MKREWFRSVRWSVVIPMVLAIALCAKGGYTAGQRAEAYLAYTQREYGESLRLFLEVGDYSGCGMVMLAMNNPDEAMDFFRRGNDFSGMGLCWAKKRQFQEALETFQRKRDYRGMGLVLLGMREPQRAEEAFSRADDWSGLGLVCLSRRDFKGARRCFKKVTDSSGLGITALKEGKSKEARGHFREIQDYSGLGLACLAERNYGEAIVCFQKVRDYAGIGRAFLAQGDFRRAEEYFTRGFDYDGLGDLYAHLHQFAKAREMFAKDYNSLKVLQCYRNDYTLPDRYQQAVAYGEAAAACGQMAPECLLELANLYYELGEISNALSALDRATAFRGYASEVHLARGRIYFYSRDFQRAKEEFSKVSPKDLFDENVWKEAQEALATLEKYQSLPNRGSRRLQPAQGF